MPKTNLFTPTGWAILVALALVLFAAGWWVITEPGRQRAKANEASAQAVVSKAETSAGKDAVTTITAGQVRDNATDRQTQENRDAILTAPGAAAPVDAGLGAAGRRAVCLRASARSLPQCRELQRAHP